MLTSILELSFQTRQNKLTESTRSQALKDIPRESFFIATKVGRNHDCEFDYSRNGVLESFKKSLKNLQLDYVDVLHIHDVEFADIGNTY